MCHHVVPCLWRTSLLLLVMGIQTLGALVRPFSSCIPFVRKPYHSQRNMRCLPCRRRSLRCCSGWWRWRCWWVGAAAAADLHCGLRPWLSSGASCRARLGGGPAARQGVNWKPCLPVFTFQQPPSSLPQPKDSSGLFWLIYCRILSFPEKEAARISPQS